MKSSLNNHHHDHGHHHHHQHDSLAKEVKVAREERVERPQPPKRPHSRDLAKPACNSQWAASTVS